MTKLFALDYPPLPLDINPKRRGVVVQCHGCFDLLHLGHIKHLEQAKSLGDVLVVTVTCDMYVGKGPDRPIYSDKVRAEMLAALSCVDYVAINPYPTSISSLLIIRPDIYVKGVDYVNSDAELLKEERMIMEKKVGGKVMFTDTPKHSTTSIIERLRS